MRVAVISLLDPQLVHHQEMLVSFDSSINTRVVHGGQDALHLIRSSP
ncbi:hypothetical protein SynRS9907_02468 [Synechococcus sp. RS9907]|nr:hypothetical protein [Synechococcus sp. RS9907]QNI83296.1 hypothetical protein SynRS9907_02468 [Synechococcus sp. RS9907]